MRKAKQTEKQYDVLLLSYTDYKKEGRCHRAYKALSEIASVYVIDVTNDPVQEPSHTGIRKEANNRKILLIIQNVVIELLKNKV